MVYRRMVRGFLREPSIVSGDDPQAEILNERIEVPVVMQVAFPMQFPAVPTDGACRLSRSKMRNPSSREAGVPSLWCFANGA
jgi:hypothetical protein